MDKDNITVVLTNQVTEEIGAMDLNKEKEFLLLQMDLFTKDNLKMD